MANSEPAAKKYKLDPDNFSIFETFLKKRKCDMEKLQAGIQALKYGLSNCQVRAVKVTLTNASFPADFTSAYLEFGEMDSIMAIGNIYTDACIILDDYINSDLEAGDIKIPDESERRKALALLLNYIQNLEEGLQAGWHGKTDILMGDVPIFTKGMGTSVENWRFPEPSCSSFSESDSSIGTEVDFSVKDYHRIFAETITYSFLKNKTGSQLSLNPLIAINKDSVQVHFYDAENDILMQSGLFPLFPRSMNLNNIAILVIWIVLNHSLFYNGSTEGMPKSGFHELINVDACKQGVKSPCHLKKKSTDQQWICNKYWASEAVPVATFQ